MEPKSEGAIITYASDYIMREEPLLFQDLYKPKYIVMILAILSVVLEQPKS